MPRRKSAEYEENAAALAPLSAPGFKGLDFRGVHLDVLADTTSQIDLEGARMSGKSWVICAKVILSCLAHPGIIWLICRYSSETTRTMLKPVFERIAQLYGVTLDWNEKDSLFTFPANGPDGKVSKCYAYGLKSQSIAESLSKVRGLELGGLWNDQSEETPQQIADELVFTTRQPGYPHQVIFSPNPPSEDHYLTDMFPEENPFPNRTYYRVSLYDNQHNLPPEKIKELEDKFPITHAKHKSLILGMRGPNVVGVPVYDGVFRQDTHVGQTHVDPSARILEAIDSGKHHPVWMVAQRTATGLTILGGVMGKRMFLEDFLPLVEHYRREWFDAEPTDRDNFRLCCDPPPSDDATGLRYTNISILKDAGLRPRSKPNASAPDVRETCIQHIAALMRRPGAFQINSNPARWIMVSSVVTKQSKLFIDGLEGSYVWDENLVSVGNKKLRQAKSDQWVDGWQRCLENIVLNFCTGQVRDTVPPPASGRPIPTGPSSWLM